MKAEKGRQYVWLKRGVLAAVVIGLAVWLLLPVVPTVLVATAVKGRIDSYVREDGRTSLPHIYHLTMPEAGRIRPLTLRAGTPVRKGDVVAAIDAADLEDEKKETEAVREAMDAASRAGEVWIRDGEAQLNFAKWILDLQKKLSAEGATSKMAMREAERDAIQSEVQYSQSRFLYHSLEAMNRAVRIWPMQVNRRLRRAILRSPIDGVVLKRFVENETELQAGDALLDIGDLSQLEITADILSEEAARLRPGMLAEISGPVVGATDLQGTVVRIDPTAITKVSSLGVEQQRVPVVIAFNREERARLDGSGQSLGLGYRVRVKIVTASRDQAVKIPVTAPVRGEGGQWKVFAVSGGKIKSMPVELGIVNDREAEVLWGLAEGVVVVDAPASSLGDGMKVKPATK